MARWFARNRGKAISVAGLGMPIGEALLPPLTVALLGFLSWRESWWLMTTFLLVVVVPVAIGLVWKGERQPKSAMEIRQIDEQQRSFGRRDVVKDPKFWLIMPAVMGPPWIFTGIFFHQVAIIAGKGWEFGGFAATFSIYAAAKVLVGLAAGILVDRFSARRVATLSMPIMAVSLIILVLSVEPIMAWLYMLLLGTHVGVHMTAVSALWPELYGRRHIGAIKSMIMSIGVFVSALGPPVFGIVLDLGWGIDHLLWFCAIYALASTALMALALLRSTD